MNWIKNIFTGRKEKETINKMASIAKYEGLFSKTDLSVIEEELPYISFGQADPFQIEKLRTSLPEDTKERFALAHYLIDSLMVSGALAQRREDVAAKILSAMDIPLTKAQELTAFLKLNIRNGLSMEDSFQRLGYLVSQTAYAS
ncbi:hypothetical protein [Marinoscillum furvescens]|uniref:Uncharacterized protein n=1 Tax=Marinoscillum furvescens DSM 4134 TaxID=1122208 RepID=A0A3D9L6D7_MARFU|nr:hypothetical protein [Marinoscillum furvescens]REE01256.1 hypothetical protein C7460_104276 [Marinoscillum furvescens DSM 4134]